MSKSEKRAFFRHIFANNFFWYIFSKLFQRIRNQQEILRFLTPFSIFSKINYFRSYLYFFRTLTANAQETAQKNGNSFFMNVSQNLIMHPSKGLHNQVVKIVVPYCATPLSHASTELPYCHPQPSSDVRQLITHSQILIILASSFLYALSTGSAGVYQ